MKYWHKRFNIGCSDYLQNIYTDDENRVYLLGISNGIKSVWMSVIKRFDENGDEDTLHWNKIFNLRSRNQNDVDTWIAGIINR